MTTGREGKHGRTEPRLYDVLVVSLRSGGGTRRFRLSRRRFLLLGGGIFLVCVLFTLLILVVTPLAMVVPIPNPVLEERYGRQILETQQRLNGLAEQVLLLRDYNTQLRKALGDRSGLDTAGRDLYPPSMFLERGDREGGLAVDLPVMNGVNGEMDMEVGLPEEFYPVGIPPRAIAHDRLPLLPPMAGFVSQEYNPEHGHYGIDFAGRRGTPVSAAADGIVVFAGWTYEDGYMLIVAHGGGYLTVYKHNQTLLKSTHAAVRRGEPVALLGTSGRTSKGPHLHFEVWKDGSPRDPDVYLLLSSKSN